MRISQDINDQELTDLLKRGSKDAFHQLYDRYGPRIHHFALNYLRSEYGAEELVQNVFLKLWDKRNLLDSAGNIKSYIYKVAVNSIYDFIRHKNLEQAFQEFSIGKAEGLDDTWEEVVYNDMLAQVEQLMQQMPEQRRKIFKMSKETGLSSAEIAERLSLSKRTVENQLYRARVFLKENLDRSSILVVLFIYLFL